jgi:hypothetical protein
MFMSRIPQLAFLILILNFIVFSQKKTDLQEADLNGKVRQVNSYEVYNFPQSAHPNSTIRPLLRTIVFNRKGNLYFIFEFSGNGKDCSYKKTIYTYDQKDRKKSVAIYQSEKGESLCIKTPLIFAENQPENLGGRLSFVEEKICQYDRKGRISNETVFDAEHKIVQQDNYEYNQLGQNTRHIITQQTNRISGVTDVPVKTIDFHISYRNKGKTRETYRFDDNKPIHREIEHLDKHQRILKTDFYVFETDIQNNVVKKRLGSTSKSYYNRNKEIFDWTIYDKNGDLETQLYILNENDRELLRLEYNHRNKLENVNQNAAERLTHYLFDHAESDLNQRLKYLLRFDQYVENPDWIPTRFDKNFYKFDSHGNITRCIAHHQNTFRKEDKYETIYETEYIYY